MTSANLLDDLNNYVPAGWARDLRHIVGCYYAYYEAPLTSDRWEKDCQAFPNRHEGQKGKRVAQNQGVEAPGFYGLCCNQVPEGDRPLF